jgi:hypothetical protein
MDNFKYGIPIIINNKLGINHPGLRPGAVQKAFFNRKGHKEGTKHTKIKTHISILCDLCEKTL